jgi:hypothetical protein
MNAPRVPVRLAGSLPAPPPRPEAECDASADRAVRDDTQCWRRSSSGSASAPSPPLLQRPGGDAGRPSSPVTNQQCAGLQLEVERPDVRDAGCTCGACDAHLETQPGPLSVKQQLRLGAEVPQAHQRAKSTAPGTRPACVDQACSAMRNLPRQVMPPAPGLSTNSQSRQGAHNGFQWNRMSASRPLTGPSPGRLYADQVHMDEHDQPPPGRTRHERF